ncbi:tRNA uridine-5-carboxymethylaminomethyl(34) synthesis GTPase MnmE [Methylobacterium frigidaeris]|uniref:tRNA modification GTPase MnmE n=1 Tax=Methylobacterium frigidaeris TaxID=2038277 RepID=A0AA37H9M2_9HYPH|nr:tRNA uridine-5-carboxymethylaminomethyl(34) synthesis GTPase MnmE [Methylobacterium frigidaeris]PIK69050.1 tRNA uridine-5-carboxymethylaminomethyl(34) synthesis GTPase MnmE [Methylobacterium frigidaeris]GJD61305.1 tRNA modification GTPase MnmE [Methylobacterium frigidaeris]
MHVSDTIFAPATGYGRTAVAVVRISGPQAGPSLAALIQAPLPPGRRLSLRTLREPATGELLDHALVAWLPGPGTATGEDMAELHLHGGPAVRAAVLRSLGAIPGLVPAEPGAFTRRAFLNGRMDLTAVEGLADLIDAETEAQRRQAVRQLDGVLGRAVEGWRASLLDVLAGMEAALDFSDEGDIDDEALTASGRTAAAHVRDAIRAALADGRRGERLRDGFTVVLAGAPNAGKSTLLNALARRDVAIVSEIPGTTRDAIEVRCDLGGLPVLLVDTAGLRDSTDAIEAEGVARSRRRIDQADLVVWLREPDGETPPPLSVPTLFVATKGDLSDSVADGEMTISARTGAGLDRLLIEIERAAESSLGQGEALVTRERQRIALERCAHHLDHVVDRGAELPAELVAEDLRLAVRALGEVAGRVGVEEMLDRLFSSFCIGK